MKSYLKLLFEGKSLSFTESQEIMDLILSDDEINNESISAFLGALNLKNITSEELAGFAFSIRNKGLKINPSSDLVMDICGTGGDGKGTFNISTASSFVISGAGIPIAKHGNRSISSRCGSNDVLEALGIKIDLEPSKIEKNINEKGLGFLSAPLFHPTLKKVAPIRKAIGLRTVFNLLGPLCNPAGVKRQVMGIYDYKLANLVTETLKYLGSQEVMIIASEDGQDEISLSGKNFVSHLKDGNIYNLVLNPEDFGLPQYDIDSVKGGDSFENANIIERVLQGEKGAYRDSVISNSSLAILISNKVKDLKEAVLLAQEAIDSGRAYKKLQEMREI